MAMSVPEEQQPVLKYCDPLRSEPPDSKWFGEPASTLWARPARTRRMPETGEAAYLLPREVGHVRMLVALP
ncbi:hypothetical protein GCM10010347_23000 [Streptomyces cirratus]|uniref:Uncharacterized protein n=1 Tax=Streptomyces cirratus TaxID=68187 RepID=A0ABQ3ER30_9ACTN|nr:hypothetical protein GCM10010347_23000 [Streptomyces cirratus]